MLNGVRDIWVEGQSTRMNNKKESTIKKYCVLDQITRVALKEQ
jgi:hypothetical protein